jgi:diketogulonate reductase-like aldo/keto reductase
MTRPDDTTPDRPSRRRFIGTAGLAAAAVTLGGSMARAQATSGPPPAGDIITRSTGRTDRTVTALGLGTFLTFDLLPGADRSALRDVTRIYRDAGVGVIDTSPLYGTSEVSVGAFLAEMGGSADLFMSNKVWSTGEYLADDSHAEDSFQQSSLRLWRDTMDVMFCHSLVNVDIMVPRLNIWKKEGRIALVGISHHENSYHDILADLIEGGQVDAVQVNYSIYNRGAEDRILPAAAANGVTVFANLVLEKARLNAVTEGLPLPDFAADIGVTTWAQYFIKWVMGDARITTTLTATANPAHAAENVACLRGPLPDAAMRDRMRAHMETIPGFADIGGMPWYPGKEAMYAGIIRRSQADMREQMGG